MTVSTIPTTSRSAPRHTFSALVTKVHKTLAKIPESAIALLARLSIAGVFWRSGQTKIEGFALDPTTGKYEFGWPHLSENALMLFEYEYALPLLAPATAALLAAIAEHLLPALLVVGFATRWAALGLIAVTAVIQFFVYPDAWPTHGTWAAILLWLAARGPGALSLDALVARRS